MSLKRNPEPADSGNNFQLETASSRKSQFWLVQIILFLIAWLAGFSTAFYKLKINKEGQAYIEMKSGTDKSQQAFMDGIDAVLKHYITINDQLDEVRNWKDCPQISNLVKGTVLNTLNDQLNEAKKKLIKLKSSPISETNIYKRTDDTLLSIITYMEELAIPLVNVYEALSCNEMGSGMGKSTCDCDELEDKLDDMREGFADIEVNFNSILARWEGRKMKKTEVQLMVNMIQAKLNLIKNLN